MTIRIGVSGWAQEITAYLNDSRFEHIQHYSLALRTNSEPIPDILIQLLHDKGATLSVHPVDFNFSDNLNLSEVKKLKRLISDLPVSYIEEDAGIWLCGESFMLSHQLNPRHTDKSINITADNIKRFVDKVETDFIIENAPVYSVHGDINCADYYSKICEIANCNLAFDIGHYVGMADEKSGFMILPEEDHTIWQYVRSIHISGIKRWIWNGIPVWIDQHSDPINEYLIPHLKNSISRAKGLENVLLEQEGSSLDTKLQTASLVKSIIATRGSIV
ncbi:DUF692 family protein [Vibrio cholerae]